MKKLTSEDPRSAVGAHLAGGGAVSQRRRDVLSFFFFALLVLTPFVI